MSSGDLVGIRKQLLDKISGRDIVVWGARMTGIGFARFMTSLGMQKPKLFIDSDPATHGKNVAGIPVWSPARLPEIREKYEQLIIVVCVSIKEDEIVRILSGSGIDVDDYIIYSDYSAEYYTIDVVGSCNLRCASCVHGSSGFDIRKGLMSLEQLERVVEKMTRESFIVSHVSLYSWGEPMLNPELPGMLEYLHGQGIAVACSTNLSYNDNNKLEKFIRSSPDYLKISLSGYYEEVYGKTHNGGNACLVKSNMYRLRYLIDKYGTGTVVDVNYHLYNNNCGVNLVKMRELCDELGFMLSTTYALVMPLERVLDYCGGASSEELRNLEKMLLVTIPEGIAASAEVPITGCPYRDNQVNINFDLSVPVCCVVYDRRQDRMVTDNYLNVSLSEINERKKRMAVCDMCIGYNLPQYNMGFNRRKWDEIAGSKACFDR